MKKGLLAFILGFFFLTSYGQTEYGFADGVIITKQGDSIKCQVEMAVTYGNKIAYRKNPNGEELYIPSKDIKSLTTPYKHWKNIQVGKKEKLMSLVVDGEAKLFNHVTINVGPSTPGQGGTYAMYNAPTVMYVLEKDGVFYELKKKDFKASITTTLASCKSVVDKVNTKQYKFDDLEKVITEFNLCK